MIKTPKTYQRRTKIKQTKHGARVTTPDRKLYNRAYQLPKKTHCPKPTNRA